MRVGPTLLGGHRDKDPQGTIHTDRPAPTKVPPPVPETRRASEHGKQYRKSTALPAGHVQVAALFTERGFACSGVVIGKRAVLTARHCLPITRVRFGQDASKPVAERRVRRHYLPPARGLDIAVLELTEDAPVTAYKVSHSTQPPQRVRAVGYGATDAHASRGAGQRRYWDLRIRGWSCDPASSVSTACKPGVELVLPRSNGLDTCNGDSGGPLLSWVKHRWVVVGITSRAVASSLLPCGDGGVYVRADVVAGFISDTERKIESWRGRKRRQ
ncbi:MAG: trypsin-like serine protease [Myxococcales bacterium]|nr:trypsin-like serine protease [Myxococcales bacterium]MCB9581282.1 trypsin-like serine protease [Polyangiaceae bacterium]